MKEKLIVLVKYFRFLYSIYYYVLNFVLNILKIFIKKDEKLILINSFGGKKYDDSPKMLYEAMKKDKRFEDYQFVWAFHKPQNYRVEGAEIIKTDSFKYFKTALKAGIWITNSGIERGLKFKNKHTLYINTWHGTPIKRMGTDINDNNKSFKSIESSNVDVFTVQSDFEAEIFGRVFNINDEAIYKTGLPRNDKLAKCEKEECIELKSKLGLPIDKKIILYAPTFREYERDEMLNCCFNSPIDVEMWKKKLSDKYCLLIRAHYEVSKMMEIKNDGFVKDVSDYENLDDLMIASDILISDYSSIFFDYSIMDKIMLHFTYDYDKYNEQRGLYFDIRNWLNGSDNEEELINLIRNMDETTEIIRNKNFRDKYVEYYGNATQNCIDVIANKNCDKRMIL